MPMWSAICCSLSGETQPRSSWMMVRQAMTADWRWSAGYLAISRSKRALVCSLSLGAVRLSSVPEGLAVDLAEHDVHRADDGDGVGQHVAAGHLVEGRQVRETGGADLQAVGLVGAVAGQVDAELALGVLDRRIGLAFGHVETF